MKKITISVLILTILLSIFSSCSIIKRVYLPGYYIEWIAWRTTKPKKSERQYLGYTINAYDALSIKPSCERIIDVEEDSQINCDEGTIIDIPNHAFVYENGGAIKCTQVTILVKEYYSMSDILEAGLTTTSANRILASAGMIYIEANCHGEKLKLRSGKKIHVKMPASFIDKSMRAFSGKLKNGIIDWKVDGKVNGATLPISDGETPIDFNPEGFEVEVETSYQDAYVLEISKLGWINCDQFYSNPKKTNLYVSADTSKYNSVALIFKSMKSVLPGSRYQNNIAEFINVPVGEEVCILAYRINRKTKQTFVGKQDLIVGETDSLQLEMEEVSLTDFKLMLKELN